MKFRSDKYNTIALAAKNKYGWFISHRSSETEDTVERIAEFNRLLKIEDELEAKRSLQARPYLKNSQKLNPGFIE
jgi:enolase